MKKEYLTLIITLALALTSCSEETDYTPSEIVGEWGLAGWKYKGETHYTDAYIVKRHNLSITIKEDGSATAYSLANTTEFMSIGFKEERLEINGDIMQTEVLSDNEDSNFFDEHITKINGYSTGSHLFLKFGEGDYFFFRRLSEYTPGKWDSPMEGSSMPYTGRIEEIRNGEITVLIEDCPLEGELSLEVGKDFKYHPWRNDICQFSLDEWTGPLPDVGRVVPFYIKTFIRIPTDDGVRHYSCQAEAYESELAVENMKAEVCRDALGEEIWVLKADDGTYYYPFNGISSELCHEGLEVYVTGKLYPPYFHQWADLNQLKHYYIDITAVQVCSGD